MTIVTMRAWRGAMEGTRKREREEESWEGTEMICPG